MPPSSPVKCMHNVSLILFVSDSHGRAGSSTSTVMVLLFLLLHASTFLTLLHLLGFLLTKLFVHLLAESSTARHQRCTHLVAGEGEAVIHGSCSENEEFDASGVFSSEESLFFFYGEGFVSDPLPEEAEKEIVDGHLEDRGVISGTVKDEDHVEIGDSLSDHEEEAEFEQKEEDDKEEEMAKKEKVVFDVNKAEQFDSKKFKLEEHTLGASLTSDSTSKSSMEWRSSAIFSDSVTECPFSSSSRRSSSHWETYTLFRKYDEEMMFFDRICAQKLTEAETFRSLKYQTRSISQRIIHKQNKKQTSHRDPYRELECVYVAQVCLAWEALSWNYNYFRQKNSKGSESDQKSCCTAWIAEQFQQFQVLLQRFIENEPYERGRRPEVFARTRIFSPKLLQVPEFRDTEADELGKEEMVSSEEFLRILEDAIRTFMIFLKADKETPCQMLKALIIKRKTSSADPNHLHFLKKTNKNSKMTLKDMLRPRRCLKRQRVKGKQEMDVLMGLTDMKIVSRVLRMPEISPEQLQWCEEKMNKVKVWDGRIQRDSSPLFFPVH
ncbi:uncharacterized protein LOC141820699 [Curcuma longa]|uniref:uncharacterized protein LOC141820699 n=1 Tax=Curcuma longa TaxID=136217 RepID=UPI003D9F69FB